MQNRDIGDICIELAMDINKKWERFESKIKENRNDESKQDASVSN
jgi:hypothetical protein